MLEVKRLKKAVVPESLFRHPSPAHLQSTRLTLSVNEDATSCWVYIAPGSRIYKLRISLEDSYVGRGKESLLIPEQTQVLDAAVVNRCPHRSEIQSIVCAETEDVGCSLLGSVDSYGHLIVSKIDSGNTDVDGLTYSVSPREIGVGEGSWCGLYFNPNQLSMAAVAVGLNKSIDVYDQDIHLRTLRTLWYPSSLVFMNKFGEGTNSMLSVAEGSQISVWDLRTKENGGCVHRIVGSVGDMLYAVSTSSSGYIATGGADRTVTVYDPRRWSAVARWRNCSKYEITGLAFSSVDPDHIYVQGVDYELFCGLWRESKKSFSFRGDSNWLGFGKNFVIVTTCGAVGDGYANRVEQSKTGCFSFLTSDYCPFLLQCSNRDVLAGWCDSGSIFVADVS